MAPVFIVCTCLFALKEEDLVEGLMENNHLLYMTSENTLKDLKNENADTNENVCITDAQKEYIRQQSNERPASPSKSPRRVKNLPYKWSKGTVPTIKSCRKQNVIICNVWQTTTVGVQKGCIFKFLDSSRKALNFHKNELRESCEKEKQFELLASTALSEGCYIGLAVIATELVCISVYCNEQIPCCNLSVSSDSSCADEMGLSLIKPMIRGILLLSVSQIFFFI